MTQQMRDPFIWENERYDFIGATDVYSLFNPEDYHLKPTAPHSACWKGFVIYFKVKDDILYLSDLDVYCEKNQYPEINGITAYENEDFYTYKTLNIKLDYTGTITIGRHFNEHFNGFAFINQRTYDDVVELIVEKGKVIDFEKMNDKG